VAWLEDQGHTIAEIEKILEKVREYDEQTAHESVFDSIDTGHFDLRKLIDQALGRESPGDGAN
jgi:hypothetical protein